MNYIEQIFYSLDSKEPTTELEISIEKAKNTLLSQLSDSVQNAFQDYIHLLEKQKHLSMLSAFKSAFTISTSIYSEVLVYQKDTKMLADKISR